ncbi:MAG: hypothetical protein AB7N71_00470 [Phycisphaerae bacterium]
MRKGFVHAAIMSMAAVSAHAADVTVELVSTQAGQTVSPGTTIDWTIQFAVSAGDNAGLALLVTDLVQDAGNPQLVDIPAGVGVPAGMENFSRPLGISNPGEGGSNTGYIGVQRGTAGARNLVQIGGGQNTFGQATGPGTGVAENANVVGGVGQSGNVVLVTSSFPAPAAEGTYTFSLSMPIANVLDQLNAPPAFSPVSQATVDSSAGSFSFTVGTAQLLGDMNCDGTVSVSDIGGFVLALTDPAGYAAQFPACDINNADVNGDMNISVSDIGPFVNLLTGG